MDLDTSIFLSIFAGVIPSLIWLIFWLAEDEHPEPKKLIFLTFIFGMATVPFVIFAQELIGWFINLPTVTNVGIAGLITIIVWALIEESAKFFAAYYAGLRKKENNEPIDPLIYMISAALGFAALENSLLMIVPLFDGNITLGVITSNMRFIGPTLLHVVSSSTIGLFIAFSYYKKKKIKMHYTLIGIILATILHSVFNLLIIKETVPMILAYSLVWVLVIVIILLIEKIKFINSSQKK